MRLKNTIKIVVLGGVGLFCMEQSYGQQDPQYTQYMYNHSNINPAYAGSREGLNIFGLYRTQWVGLEGAPKTATLSVNTPLGESGLGLGVNFVNDHLGVMDDNTLSVDLSYAVNLNYNYKLAFGIKGSANLLDVNYSKLHIYNPTDPVAEDDIKNEFTPNIGAGLFLYSDKAYVGVSVPTLLTRSRYDDNNVKTMREKMHLYLTGGYVFDLNRDIKFKPAAMVKMEQGSPLQVDVSANFMFVDKFTAGVAYRWDAAVSGMVGFQVSDNIMVGYSYDAETSKLARYNSGSHEIFMRFTLFNSYKRIAAPRFF
ncbi:type IX secretion system membrane protein PorP/SprF [Myroides sp. 1354]|uniref:PorP/SprF family type IX secretion system membrane protein n=1 Tax=unclassified Myroides TaxID=2642485 RepID=UPI002576F0CE|nr:MULTISPECIES: type IX secretion system membrane protein PorP/SprF [unclassified Myroides]MDM1044989.1 type IX secretion system membrane protein PorP/SprF [Myroides sp. R163-1]MDM1055871.1 type IX secretion system membrane protein PorP/SprF [Myroides sp. 1354]MDM1069180.1 type IX secretion system membrane protein PorP/SprF [Myroides sp. 1372]